MSDNFGADLNAGVRKARIKLLLSVVPFVLALILLLWFMVSKVLVADQVVEEAKQTLNQEQQPIDTLTVDEFLNLTNSTISVSPEGRLIVNGELKANGAFILDAVDDPKDAKSGQVFYSKQSNEIKYFDGEQFLTLDNRALESNVCFKGAADCGFLTTAQVQQLLAQQQQASIPLAVDVNTLTTNGVLLGQGTGRIIATGAPGAGQILIGNAGGVPAFTTLSGDLTVNGSGVVVIGSNVIGAAQLSSSGVGAGTYGSNSEVPVFTVDEDGRITSVTNIPIVAGVGDIINGGQAGPVVIGTDDATGLTLETANTPRLILSAAGQLTISGLNCSGNANGGALTADGSGNISCSDDNTSAGSGITSLGGQTGAVQTFADDTNVTIVSAADTHTLTWVGQLAVGRGGTGANTAAGARSNLGAAASGANSDITSLSGLTTALSILQGGTGATTAGGARTNLGAATSGANSDITSLSGLTTALSVAQGGTGSTTANGARSNLGAAASGANSDITSLSGLTTALSVTQGGTGATTFTANGLIYGNGTGALQVTAAGTTGQCLLATTGLAPSWGTCTGDGTGITTLNGRTDASQSFAVGTSGTDFTIDSSTSTHTFNIPDAGTGARGLVTAAAQTIAGVKTFTGSLILGVSSSANGSITFLNSTNGQSATLNAPSQTLGNTTISFPDTGVDASDTVCLQDVGNCVGGGSGGAPNSAAYITVGNNATLSNERAITAGTNLSAADGGAGSTYTFNVVNNPTFSGLITANGGITIGAAQALTLNSDVFTDLTGTGLQINAGSLETTLGTTVDLTAEVTGVLPDGNVSDTLTIGASSTVADGALSVNVSLLGTSIDLASEISGTLAVSNGGTGATTAQAAINNLSGLTTNGDILYFNGTNTTRLPRGSSNQCLLSNATTIVWGSCTAGGGGFTSLTLDADSGTPETINDTDTISILGGSNVSTLVGAADSVTVSVVSNPTFSGLITANGGLTFGASQLLTINGDGFSDLTGTGLQINAGVLETTLGVSVDLTSEVTGVLPDGNVSDTLTIGASSTVADGALSANVSLLGAAIDLASEVTGTLPIANGGTGATTAQGAINNLSGLTTEGDLLYRNATNTTRLPRGGNGECLLSTTTTIQWGSCTAGGGITSLNGLTSATQTFTDDTNVTIVSAGSAHVITWSGQLSVGRGGTGSATAAGARSNLGAAVSGANNDITSMTALTAITPGASLTVGATGQTLTLQGSASSSITATDSGNTTTIGFVTPTANATINFPALSAGTYQVCTTSGNCLGGGGGANTALSNLSSVAINTALLPGNAGTIDLGSSSLPFRDLYLSGSSGTPGTNNYTITGAATSPRTITLPDASGNVCLDSGNCVGGGSGGAPNSAAFITIGNNATLTNERAIAAGTNLSAVDGGADSSYTLNVVSNPTFSGLITANGGLTVEAGDTFTFNNDGFTDLTGTGLQNNAGSLETTLGTTVDLTSEVTGVLPDGNVSDTLTIGASSTVADGALSANVSLLGAAIDLASEVTGTLPVSSGGTGATTALGARGNLGAAASGANSDITSLSGLTTALSVTQGGTGATTFTNNGVLYGNGTGAILATAAGTTGQCLLGNTGSAPTWGTCTGAGGISSLSLDADTGTPETLGDNDTITIAGGSNISTSVSATDTVTISVANNPTFSGLITANGGITFGASDVLTINGDAFTDLTGTGLQINAGVLETTLGTSVDLTSEVTGNLPDGNVSDTLTIGASSTVADGALSVNVSLLGSSIDLTSEITGTLAVANGGTGATTAQGAINAISGLTTEGDLLFRDATNSTRLPRGSSGQCLLSTTTTIQWGSCTAGGGITNLNGQTGATQTFANDTNVTINSSGDTHTLGWSGTLSVARGGTGSGTASGARSNLSAAELGANSDITSLSALTAITPGAALTIGATGQSLTLQGSAATTLMATDSGFTTTIGFVTPTANATINFPALGAGTYQVCTTSGNCLGGGSGGANTALSNLTSVAINTSLLTGNGSVDLGSDPAAFRNAFFSGSINFEGSSADGSETTISVVDPTADITYRFADAAAGTYDICTTVGNCLGGSSGGAPNSAAYITIGNNATLTGERAISIGSNLSAIDNGADSTYQINVVSNPTFTGPITANGGLTVGAAQTLTINGDGFSDLTGTGLQINSGVLETTLGTSVDLTSEVTGVLPDANVSDTLTIGASSTVADGALSANVSLLGAAIDLASEVTGTLPIGNGGTGATTQQGAINNLSGLTTNGDLLYHNGTNSTRLARGSDTQCLLSTTTTIQWGTCTGDGVGIASLTLDGDSGTPETLGDGNTITIAGGTDIATVVGSTDTITVNNTSTLSSVTGRGATTTTLLNLDGGIAVDTSNFTVSGTTGDVLTAGVVTIQGGTATLGTTTQAGSLVVSDGSSNTVTINVNPLSGNYTLSVPTITGNDTFCLAALGNCNSSGHEFTAVVGTTGGSNPSTNVSAAGYVGNGDTGAANDGDQVQINNAISAVASAGGGMVFLLEGTYTIDNSILLDDNVTLLGSGPGTIILSAADGGSANDFNLIENTDTVGGNHDVAVKDLMIDGNSANVTASSRHSIYFENVGSGSGSSQVNGFTINEVHIADTTGGHGIAVDSSYNSKITDSFIKDGQVDAINIVNAARMTISNNRIAGGTDNAIELTGTTNSTISNNLFDDTGVSSDAAILLADGADYNTIDGNVIQNTNGVGIGFNSSTGVGGSVISNNLITGSEDQAIWMNLTFATLITGNTFIDNETTGSGGQIEINGNSDQNNITANYFEDTSGATQSYAIILNGSLVDDTYVSDNIFVTTDGISDTATNTIYANQLNADSNDVAADLVLQAPDSINILSNTDITGTLTVSSVATFNGNTVIGSDNADTLTINAGTSGSGITFGHASFANCSSLETVSGVLTCGSDDTGSGSVTLQGAYDNDANGSDAVIALTSTDGALVLRDAASTIGTLFVVEANGGADYLSVASTGVSVGTGLTVTSGNNLTLANNTSCINLKTNSGGVVSCGANENTYVVAATDSVNTAAANYVADGDTGAANDGDQVQINSAITAANTAGGGVVQLLEGTYTIDASVLMLDNVILKGAGDGTIIRFAASYSPGVNDEAIENAGTVYDVEIRDLTIDVNDDAQTNDHLGGIALVAGSGSDGTSLRGATIDNVSIFDTKSYAISLDGSDHSTVNNVFIDCNNGGNNNVSLYFNATTNIRLSNSRITDCGILQVGGNHNTIVGNNISYTGYNHPTAGGALDVSSDYNTITGNTITSSFGPGIFADNNATITGNTIIGGNSYGIACISSGNITIGNNLIRDNGNDGINFNACSDVQISNNNIINNTGEGLYLTNSSSIANITITGNNFEANTDQGIEAWTGVHNLVISNNSFKQNATNAVYLNGANDNIVQGNSFYDNGSTGSNATLAISGDGNSAIGNNFYDSAGTSTFINIASGSDDTYLADNYFDQDSTYSAAFSDSGTGTIYANQMDANLALRAGAEASMYLQNSTNSTNALQVRNISGTVLLNVDTSAASGTNLLINSGVESGTTNFAAKTSTTISQSSTYSYNGSHSLLAATTAAANGGANALYQLAASTQYTVSFYARLDSGSMTTAQIGYSTNGSTDTSCATGQTINTTWTRISCTFTTGGSVSGTRYVYLKQTDASARNIYIDAVQLEAAASVSDYNLGSGKIYVSAPLTVNTLAVSSLGASDTSTYLCRNSSNLIAGCTVSPLSSSLTDNVTNAFDLQEGTNNYININTTNASENISFGNATTNPSFNFLGSGTLNVAGDIDAGLINGLNIFTDYIQFTGSGASNKFIETVGNGSGDSDQLTINTGGSAGAGATSGDLVIITGNGTGTGTDSGSIDIDTGTATGTAGTIAIGGSSASGLTLGRSGLTTSNAGGLTVAQALTVNGNTIIGNANTDTLTINAGASGTGISFGDASFANCSALETVSGVLTCGADDTGSGSVTLQTAYGNDADGSDTIIALTTADDSLIFRNPASSGSDSTYILTLDQLATGAVGGLDIQSAGSGNLLRLRDTTATATDVLTVADNGVTTITKRTGSGTGTIFQINDESGASVLNVDTSSSVSANNILTFDGVGVFGSTTVNYGGSGDIRIGNNYYSDIAWTGGTGGYGYSILPTTYSGASANYSGFTLTQSNTFTSGSGNAYNAALINPTLNVSGGATATYRGLYVNPTLTGFSDFRGLEVNAVSSYATANNQQGGQITVTDTGNVSSGTDTTLGASINVTRTGASGGTINNTGLNISVTGDTGGTSTNTGLNVSVTGADTNYAAIFQGGNVGIGDTSPAALLTVGASDAFQVDNSGNVNAAGTVMLGTLGTTNTSTYLCRNSSNIIAGCASTPLTNALTDNVANAFDLQEGTNNYININTTNGSENISFGNATTNPSFNFLGSGDVDIAGDLNAGVINGVELDSDYVQFQNGGGGIKSLNTSSTGFANSNSLYVNTGHTSANTATSGNLTIFTGDGTGTGTNSGSISIDVGTATGTAGTISLGTSTSSSLLLGRAGASTTLTGSSGSSFVLNGVTVSATEFNVLDAGIELGDLTTQGTATDEFCLTSETGGGALLAWQACSSTTLQGTYDNDADGSDAIIALTSADDSLILRNPASGGTDSTYILTLDQLSTGAKGGLLINQSGTGYAINVNTTSPFTVDSNGYVGIGSATPFAPLYVAGNQSFEVNHSIQFNSYFNSGDKYISTDSTFQIWHDNTNDQLRIQAAGSGTSGSAVSYTDALVVATNGSITLGQDLAVNGNTTIGNASSDTLTVNATGTFNTDVNLTFAGTENLAVTSDLAGTVDGISFIGTPSASAGTTRGIVLQQANSANTNGLDTALLIDNADTNLAIATGIQFTSSGGGFTNFLDTPSIDISGTGAITGATGISSSGTVTFSGYTNCTNITTNGSGVLACSSTPVASTLQNAYDNDANGSNAVIALTSTDGALVVQDAASTIGNLFTVEANGGTDYLNVSSVLGTEIGNSAFITAKSNATLSGTAAITSSAYTVTGSSTFFTTELHAGDYITIDSQKRKVNSITNDTSLTVDAAWTTTVSGQTITRHPAALTVNDSSNNRVLLVQDDGRVNIGNVNSVDTTAKLTVQNSSNESTVRAIGYFDTTAGGTASVVDLIVNQTSSASAGYAGQLINFDIWGGAQVDNSAVTGLSVTGSNGATSDLNLLQGIFTRTTAFGAGTTDFAIGIGVDDGLTGANLNNSIGIGIADRTAGTNRTNLYIAQSGFGYYVPQGGIYSIYNGSTSDNVFVGDLRVGSTSAPTVALDVTGAASVSSNLAVNTNTLFANASNGRVGVGTASPDTNLHVNGNAEDASLGAIMKLTGSATSTTNDQRGANLGILVAPSASSSRNYFGVDASATSSSANFSSSAVLGGITASGSYTGSATLLSLTAGYFKNSLTSGTGSATNSYGIYIDAAVDGSSGSISNNYGLYVADQTAGTTDYNIYSAGSGSANLMQGTLRVEGTLSTVAVVPITANTYDLGSSTLEYDDMYLGDDGIIYFGSAQDTRLTHSASNNRLELTGDGSNNEGTLFISNTLSFGYNTFTATDNASADDTLNPVGSFYVVDVNEAAGAGDPNIVLGEPSNVKSGDLLYIVNVETDGSFAGFTINDSAGAVEADGTTYDVYDSATFIYLGMNSLNRWVRISSANN